MRILSYILMLLVILLGITFACLNAEIVTVNYYLGHSAIPLSLLLAYTLIFGSVLGFFSSLKWTLRLKRDNRQLNKCLQTSKKEVENLRAIPFKDEC